MLNNSHFYNSLLSQDIENNINAKIEKIKNTNKWSDLDVKSACEKIEFSKLGINDLKYHAAMVENISKLSVDLILDYDYYKNFNFKRHFMSVDYDDKFKMLGYEIEGEIWHSVKKPSKDTVIMNVFLSCLYNSLVEIKPTVEECPFCDNRIEPDDEKCSMCGEPVANMSKIQNSYKRNLSNNINMNDDIKNTKFDSVQSLNEINTGGEINTSKLEPLEAQSGKDEISQKNMKIFHDILKKNENQWICNSCECLNAFNLVNCQACGADCKVNGYWMCCHCGLVSGMCTDICAVCDAKNVLIVPDNKWKCWKPHCNELNDDKFRFCNKCGLQRIPPVLFSDLVERKVQGQIIKFWICEKCWQYNNDNSKFCAKTYCNEPRFQQMGQLTDKTNMKTDLNRNEEQTEWKCWNKKCERMNKIGHHFCQNCKLDKTPPDPETKLVKSHTGNEVRQIWICGKCEKCNAKYEAKCEGKSCGSYKFHKSNDCKDDKNKSAINVNKNEIQTNSCEWECRKCTFINKSNSISCTVCDSKRNDNSNSNSWKCWFVNCKQVNDDQYRFCQNCRLDRLGNRSRGALVQCLDQNGTKDIWICQKCFKYNSLSDAVCGGKICKNQRFQN